MLLCCWRTRGTRGEEGDLCQSLQLKMGIQQGPNNWEHLGTNQEGDDGGENCEEEEERLRIQTKTQWRRSYDMDTRDGWHITGAGGSCDCRQKQQMRLCTSILSACLHPDRSFKDEMMAFHSAKSQKSQSFTLEEYSLKQRWASVLIAKEGNE